MCKEGGKSSHEWRQSRKVKARSEDIANKEEIIRII